MSRVQLVQKSHPNASLLGIHDWALPGLTAAQCLRAQEVDLGITKKEPRQRMALCKKHLATNPNDVITSAGIRSHFGLNAEEVLSALTALEQGRFRPEVKLCPLYPASDWEWERNKVEVDLRLNGSYWHPLEVFHLHAVSRRVLSAQQIHERRIFPGVGLRDIAHHLQQVKLPNPGEYRVRSREKQGQLTARGRSILLAYLRYLQQARQFITLAAIEDLCDVSSTLMSSLSAKAGWDRRSYYAFRKAAYRELVSRYIVSLPGAEGIRASDVVVAQHATWEWGFSAEMIHRNILPQVPVERLRELGEITLPVMKLAGVGSQLEWFTKIPSRKLLFDVLRDHFGMIPRWEIARMFHLTENSFTEILAAEKVDVASWDAAWRDERNKFVFYLPGLDQLQSADCLHVQVLKGARVGAREIARLQLIGEPLDTVTKYLGIKTGLKRARLPLPERESHQLDLRTYCALLSYLKFHAGKTEQRFIEEYFGIGHAVLRKARKRVMAAEPTGLGRWSTRRKGLAQEHFGSLRQLFGLGTGLATAALHVAATAEATGADPESLVAALMTKGGVEIQAAATRLVARMKSPTANGEEVKALSRHYLAEHPGVPLGPLSAVTGLTKRILSNLRPRREKPGLIRNDWWKAIFKQSPDFAVWSALRTAAGHPLNGWRR
jgi:hypothetical protein